MTSQLCALWSELTAMTEDAKVSKDFVNHSEIQIHEHCRQFCVRPQRNLVDANKHLQYEPL